MFAAIILASATFAGMKFLGYQWPWWPLAVIVAAAIAFKLVKRRVDRIYRDIPLEIFCDTHPGY